MEDNVYPLEPPEPNRPLVRIKGGNLSSAVTDSEEALLHAGSHIYQRGPILVRPVIESVEANAGRRTEVGTLIQVGKNYLRDSLNRAADYERWDTRAKAWVKINPPMEVADTLLARAGEWQFKPISGVISAPTLRPDGSLLSRPGYDARTRLFLIDTKLARIEIAASPTQDEAAEAASLLTDLLEEFPFADGVAKSVALSALITPVVRGAFAVAPMHATRAPQAGTGKSFLLDVAAAIAMGQPCPIIAAGRSPEELEKRLNGALLSGQPIVSIDNVVAPLSGDLLCQAVERPMVILRALGSSDMIRVENRMTFFASGNNLSFADDMTRRGLICQMDAGLERPETRRFSFNPMERVLMARERYVRAALTICRAYIAAERPGRLTPLASFEGWSDTVRSSLTWLGYADPLDAMERVREEDPVRQAQAAVFYSIRDTIGLGYERRFTAAQLAAVAEQRHEIFHGKGDLRNPQLHATLIGAAGRRGQIDGRLIGKWFQTMKHKIVSGLRLEWEPDDKRGHRWYLVSVADGGNVAFEEFSPPIPTVFPQDGEDPEFNDLDP